MLFRKMIRDIRNNKMQFFSIALMAFLAMFVYAGLGSEWYTFRQEVNNYYEETNMADAWLYGSNFSDSQLHKLENIDGITGLQKRLHLEGTADLEGEPELEILLVQENVISNCQIKQGAEFDPEADGIWINEMFAKARGLEVGDFLTIEMAGQTIEKEILGLMIHPEYVYACASFDSVSNPYNIGIVYAGINNLPAQFPQIYNEVLITTDNDNYEALKKQIDNKLSGEYSVFLSRNSLGSYKQFDSEILSNKAMADVFPFVFLAIALLTILTTMTRIVNNQRTLIGALKSLGFRNREIMWHYVSYGLVSSLMGTIAGLIVGPLTLTPFFFSMQTGMYELVTLHTKLLPSALIVGVITVAGCTLVTYLSCRKILKENPAQALRPKAPKAAKRTWLEKMELWKKMGFDFQWNFRDAIRSKVRSLMAIAGISGCMALLVCGFGMFDSIQNTNDWKFGEMVLYTNKIPITEKVPLSDITYHGESIEEASIEIRVGDMKKTTGVTVLEDEAKLTRFTDKNRNYMKLPTNGIALTYKMAQLLDVEVGDEVSWHLYGDSTWVTSKVKALYRDPVAQGITLYESYFEELGFHYEPTAFLTNENIPEGEQDYTIWNIKTLRSSMDEMMEMMYSVIYIMIAAAIVMAIVVLYNLGILSFTEKQREFATLRVLGFKSRKIRKLLLSQNIWLSVLGLYPGYLIGKTIIDVMMQTIGDDYDMMTYIQPGSIVISVVMTMATSVLVNVLFSKKIKDIDMVSALKGVE